MAEQDDKSAEERLIFERVDESRKKKKKHKGFQHLVRGEEMQRKAEAFRLEKAKWEKEMFLRGDDRQLAHEGTQPTQDVKAPNDGQSFLDHEPDNEDDDVPDLIENVPNIVSITSTNVRAPEISSMIDDRTFLSNVVARSRNLRFK